MVAPSIFVYTSLPLLSLTQMLSVVIGQSSFSILNFPEAQISKKKKHNIMESQTLLFNFWGVG